MTKTTFETKIKPILNYVGVIGASCMCVAYVIAVFVLIQGFKASVMLNALLFAAVNAVVGFIIMQFLKVQGIAFAKLLPENEEVVKDYYSSKTKDKKPHSMKFYWIISILKDIFTKCLGVGISSAGLIYIVIQGSNDYNLLLLAAVNLIMFICFGFLALVNAYDFFNNKFVPYMKEKIDENKTQEPMAVAKEKCVQQGNAIVGTNSGSNILDTSVDTCAVSPNNIAVVVDNSERSDSILGRPLYPCSTSTDSTGNSIKENIYKEN